MELNENENTMYHNMWNTAKAVQREKFIGLDMKKYLVINSRTEINEI